MKRTPQPPLRPKFQALILPVLFLLLAGAAQAGSLHLVNGGFEADAAGGAQTQDPAKGWLTTATDSQIEIWSAAAPYSPWGPDNPEYVTAYEGTKFAELNATQNAALYQDVDFTGIPAGTQLNFGFAHRGRSGLDTMRLRIVDLGPDGQLGGGDDGVLFSKEYSTGKTAWAHYTDTATLAAANRKVRFYYEAVSTAGGDATVGNFFDACEFGVGSPFSTAGWWNGTASSAWNTSPDLNWSKNLSSVPLASDTFSAAMLLSSGVAYFADGYFASGTEIPVTRSTVNIAAGGVSATTVVFLGDTVNYILASADANGISGSTALNKSGLSTLTLSGVNTFSGATTITAGAVKLANANALSNSTVTVSANNGLTFQSGIGTFLLGGLTGGNNLALTDTASGAVTLQVGTNNAGSTYSGVLSGSGGLTKVGNGTLLLTANSTFTGGTVVNAGTLSLNRANSGNNNSQLQRNLTINSGATLNLAATGGNPFGWGGGLTNISLNGGTANGSGYGAFGIVYTMTGGTVNSPGRMDLGSWAGTYGAINSLASSTESVVSADGIMLRGDSGQTSFTNFTEKGSTSSGIDLRINAAISQNGAACALVKEGPGTLLLTAKNTFTGGTVVNGGTLSLNGEYAANGNSQLQGVLTVNSSGNLNLLGTHPFGWGGGLTSINLNGGTAIGRGFTTYGIVYNLKGGTLNSSDRMYLGKYGTDAAINSLASSAESVVSADGIELRGDSSQTNFTISTEKGSTSSGIDLRITTGIGQYVACGLNKQGNGTLLLSGASTYSGTTTVGAGSLLVNGSLGSSSAVTVSSVGTLGGSGTVSGMVALSGAIAPGAGVGTLNTGAESWNGGGSYTCEISDATGAAGTGWDLLNITGALAVDATNVTTGSKFNIRVVSLATANFDNTANYTWRIATASGGVTGFDASKFTIDDSGFSLPKGSGHFDVNQSGNDVYLQFGHVSAGNWTGIGGSAWDAGTTLNWTLNARSSPLDIGIFSAAMTSSGGAAYFDDYYYTMVLWKQLRKAAWPSRREAFPPRPLISWATPSTTPSAQRTTTGSRVAPPSTRAGRPR